MRRAARPLRPPATSPTPAARRLRGPARGQEMPASGPVTIRHVIDDEILLLDRRAALLTDPELAERSDNAVIASVDQPLEVLGPSAHERGEPSGPMKLRPSMNPGAATN